MNKVSSQAGSPVYHRFRSSEGEHVLVVPYSRIFDLPVEWRDGGSSLTPDALRMMEALALPADGEVALDLVPLPPVRSISLNVSASCNLACGYCYAGRGAFGGRQPAGMDWAVAKTAVDRLLAGAGSGQRFTIGFLGGEPFLNSRLIHQVVDYSSEKAARTRVQLEYSVTTNATLLDADDRRMLREHPFAVTVSIDGTKETQDRQRPVHSNSGRRKSSWDALESHLKPLLADPGIARIAARATVSRHTLELEASFAAILDLGFEEVGFSPLRHSADADQGLAAGHWPTYLAGMTRLAQSELRRAADGSAIRLTNFAVALRQLHRGWSSPFSCGAGGGYFSVATDGEWYACHRAIGQSAYRMGNNERLDDPARKTFLMAHHVHAQTDCSQCWARYLCSGGCHQESPLKSSESCDFIRAWLEFCLSAYCVLISKRPAWFANAATDEV
jgi:uncharacterized protein